MSGAQTGAILQVRDLEVTLRGRQAGTSIKAVDRVSFDVARGEVFGVIGESGSGKTTLGRAVVCLTPPTGGQILFDGAELYGLPAAELRRRRRDVQMVFQDPAAALDPRMTVLQSVREPLDVVAEIPVRAREDAAAGLLERVGLSSALHARYPHQLSGGQKQRVNIARALTTRPRLIVCDEAVAALDVSIQADILNLFEDLRREYQLTYMFISHDLGVVSHVSDRVAVMYLGRLVEMGPAATITSRPRHPYTQALLSSEPVPLPRHLRDHGRRVILQGEIPSPLDPPSGCRFRTRCPLQQPVCAAEEPAWRQIAPNHLIACHFVEGDGQACLEPSPARATERRNDNDATWS